MVTAHVQLAGAGAQIGTQHAPPCRALLWWRWACAEPRHVLYALKPAANSMHPAAGAILWAASSEAEPGDLDLHVSATHLFNPAASGSESSCLAGVAASSRGEG